MNISAFKGQRIIRRTLFMTGAVTLMGLGVSLCILGDLGTDPCSSMNLGISSTIGFTFGMWQAIFNTVILIAVLILDRSLIGIGTFVNMFGVGFAADFFAVIWARILPNTHDSMVLRFLFMGLGTFLMIFSCSFYMTADLGISPYDCVAFVIIDRNKKLKYKWVRMVQDGIALTIGFALGATVGVGTAAMVLLTGPLIPICNRHIAAKAIGMEKVRGE